MKITTKKIIRELEKRGWNEPYLNQSINRLLISNVKDVIDEILRIHKNISIKK